MAGTTPTVTIIGGGSTGIWLARLLHEAEISFELFDRNKRLGAKFLVAGKGGFNLSRTESVMDFRLLYPESVPFTDWFSAYSPTALQEDLLKFGIPNFIGSSGKIFPKELKPIEVLDRLLSPIEDSCIHVDHQLVDIDPEKKYLSLRKSDGTEKRIGYTNLLLALGSKSWPKTGSCGEWVDWLPEKLGLRFSPFNSSNCTLLLDPYWTQELAQHQGQALKQFAASFSGLKIDKGELVFTERGMEGNGIYPLIPLLKEKGLHQKPLEICITLKPTLSEEDFQAKLKLKGKKSWKKFLEATIRLNDLEQTLFHINRIKKGEASLHIRIPIIGLADPSESISNGGGIELEQLTEQFETKKHTGIFVGGEMVNWDVPTGGYLLHTCFTMAKIISKKLISVD